MTIAVSARPPFTFAARGAFGRDLDRAAKAYFDGAKMTRRDLPRMYLKTLVILLWFALSWFLLVFVARGALQGTACAMSLGLSIAAVGMSIQHDANHEAYSRHAWVNRIFGATLDVMGVCSLIWRPKHNVGHHTYTNVEGVDYDVDFGALARLTPAQRHRSWHRYQHLYLWLFYGFLLPKWVFYDDWVIMRQRRVGVHKIPKPGGTGIASFVGWKLFFVAWSIVIPALFHPLWQVLVFHAVAAATLGMTLGTVFQLAHCTRRAQFPSLPPPGERASVEWAVHQLATTVDFAPKSRILTWFVGGLNFQVEHHLFPKVCHLHYPALAQVVTKVAREHGLERLQHRTLGGALASHFAHLRALSRKPGSGIALTRCSPSASVEPLIGGPE